MFSDEAVFYLDGGINTHNCSYWSRTSYHGTIKIAELAESRGLGSSWSFKNYWIFFHSKNISGETNINLLTKEFYPAFSGYPYASELHFMQDGAPPC